MTQDKDTKISRDEQEFAEYIRVWPSTVPKEFVDKYFPDGFTVRDEANAIVALAFRNGPIERFHAGEYSELLENQSLSRITNPEMKEVILFACQKIAWLLRLKESEPEQYQAFIQSYAADYCYEWDR